MYLYSVCAGSLITCHLNHFPNRNLACAAACQCASCVPRCVITSYGIYVYKYMGSGTAVAPT